MYIVAKRISVFCAYYAIGSASDSKVVSQFIDNNFSGKTLEELIESYAQKRLDIWTTNSDFAHRLHEIARRYEGSDYRDRYGGSY